MKIALNNQNVISKPYDFKNHSCRKCCFTRNLDLCHNLGLRTHYICLTIKVLDSQELNDIFKI